jgi:2,3,4,5-tetrahydropyridine-2-carboxylate N-succinyltransferase
MIKVCHLITYIRHLLFTFVKNKNMSLQQLINEAWANRELLKEAKYSDAVRAVIEEVDKGRLRTAEPLVDSQWQVNEWVKQAILMYFGIQQMETRSE